MKNSDITWQESYDFIVCLANCLTEYGAAVYEIEDVLLKVAAHLNVGGNYIILNQVLLVTSEEDSTPKTSLSLLPTGGPIINKLEAVSKVVHKLLHNKIDIMQAKQRLDGIEKEPEVYGPIIDYMCWPLLAAGFGVYFGGGVNECLVAGLISAALYGINKYFSQVENIERRKMFEPVAAVTSSLLALLGAVVLPPLSVPIASLAGLMMLMPGLSLTKALNEIALGHTITGMSRLLNALTTLLLMASGVFLGSKVDSILNLTAKNFVPPEPSVWLILIGVIVATYASCIFARVRQRHFIFVLLIALIISVIIIWGSRYLGPSLATGIASIITALGANAYSRWRDVSDSIIKVPNAFILVPGAMGFSAIVLLINNEIMMGIDKLLSTIGVAISIIAGFIIADIICPARRIGE